MSPRLKFSRRARPKGRDIKRAPLRARAKDLQAKIAQHLADRSKTLEILRLFLDTQNQQLNERFLSGDIGAIACAEKRARIYDNLIAALFYANCAAAKKQSGCLLALCAVGGYGRGELAPYSDLDLLFLIPDQADPSTSAPLIENVLYLLWDLGLKIGHAHRTANQSIKMARQDDTVLSGLLDLRLVAGDAEPVKALQLRLRKLRTRPMQKQYIASKLGARDARHEKAGNSRYVIEPNVKEGKGGLRDLHELYWIARFVYGGHDDTNIIPLKPHKVNAYIRHGLLNKHAAKRFGEAAEFLWAVRTHLHCVSGRANEVLSFDLQDAVAKRMGYKGATKETRVEAFMLDYFNTAKEVGALTRIACARLEEQSQLLLPQGLYRFMPSRQKGLNEPGFKLIGGRLSFSSRTYVRKNPDAMLKLFFIAGQRNLDIHPESYAHISENLKRVDPAFRAKRENAELFFDILTGVKAPGATLMAMNESGLLGAYIPEFGEIVGHTQFNMHHAFTVDDHTIALVRNLHSIEVGDLKNEHPVLTELTGSWNRRTRLLVYMACLLHDVGKGQGDQCIEGARLAIQACTRMGMDDADIETIAWLVRNHLLMSETAQRRDISDPKTVQEFVKTVGSIKRLQMLCALTVVDIRSVGPGIWNDWKGALLHQLYEASRAILLAGIGGKSRDSRKIFALLMEELDSQTAQLTRPIFEAMPQSYWQTHRHEDYLGHVRFVAKARKHGLEHASKTIVDRKRDITELWVYSRDRLQLFADLSMTIAKHGANIVGAHLHTSDDGAVFDVFFLQNSAGAAFGRKHPTRLRNLKTECTTVAQSGIRETFKPGPYPSKRAKAIPVTSRVSVLERGAGLAIVEVEGRDRPGLLGDLANAFAQHNLAVKSAHIDVAGPKAVDVFYIAFDKDGEFDDVDLQNELKTLLNHLHRTRL